jgi:hypothetical protein
LSAIDKERNALEMLLEPLTPEQITAPGMVGDWSIKDVLAHIIEWEQMVLMWHVTGLRGEIPELPAPGFKWNQTPVLNHQIYEKHRARPLDIILKQFQASH